MLKSGRLGIFFVWNFGGLILELKLKSKFFLTKIWKNKIGKIEKNSKISQIGKRSKLLPLANYFWENQNRLLFFVNLNFVSFLSFYLLN